MHHVVDEQQTMETERTHRSGLRAPLLLMLVGLLILMMWMGLKAWRVYTLSQSLLSRQTQAEALMANGISQTEPDEAEAFVNGLRSDIVALKREVGPFVPLTAYLGWVPKYGPTLKAAPHLLEMADAGTEAAAFAMRGLKPSLSLLQDDNRAGSPLQDLVRVVDSAEADLVASAAAMERVVVARNEIKDVTALDQRIRTLFSQFDERLPMILASLRFAPALPALMGMDAPRTYLLIAQNQDELRPTGGYHSGAGILEVENGEIVSLDFIDANLIGNWQEKPFGFPPQRLYDLMGLELFLFRDANFWPDFPTSAEQSLDLASYSLDYPALDGALAIDQEFLAVLLAVTGPVDVPELELRVDQNNAIEQLQTAWQRGEDEKRSHWIGNRKDFLGPFASALRTRFETDLGSMDLLYLSDTLIEAIAQKHLQIYMRDEQVAAILDELGWDGRLENGPAEDVLMVVDSNVGYNKINPLIDRALEYNVTLDASGEGVAELDVKYAHGGEPSELPCGQRSHDVYADGDDYGRLVTGCYMNYLRTYAPAGSTLLEASRHFAPSSAFHTGSGWDQPAETIVEHPDVTTFANFFLLPEGETLTSSFRYRLPTVVSSAGDDKQYQLTVYRQAGMASNSLQVQITLPAGTTLSSASPEPASVSDQTVVFVANLDRDLVFTVIFR